MKNYKCISNTETESHVSWGQYFTVGETYREGKLPKELDVLQKVIDERGDSLVLIPNEDYAPAFVVPINQFKLVE